MFKPPPVSCCHSQAEAKGAGDRWPALLCKAFARQGGVDPRAFCAETAAHKK